MCFIVMEPASRNPHFMPYPADKSKLPHRNLDCVTFGSELIIHFWGEQKHENCCLITCNEIFQNIFIVICSLEVILTQILLRSDAFLNPSLRLCSKNQWTLQLLLQLLGASRKFQRTTFFLPRQLGIWTFC
jgi:hypothetical protein